MNNDDAANFKIRLDDDEGEDVLDDDELKDDDADDGKHEYDGGDSRVVKSSRRALFIAIFFTCIVGIGLALAYFDIKERLTADISEGAIAVTNLSKELESRFSDIASNYEALGEKTDSAISKMSNTITDIEKTVKGLKSSKTDVKEFNNTLDGLKNKFSPIEKDILSVKSDFKAVKTEIDAIKTDISSFKTEISGLTQSLQKAVAEINTAAAGNAISIKAVTAKLDEIKNNKLDKDAFDASFNAENERYAKLIGNLNQELGSLKFKIKTLENNLLKTEAKPQSAVNPAIPGGSGENGITEQTIR